jgi:hypothetical protein
VRKVARCCIAAIAIPLAPVVTDRFGGAVSLTAHLSFSFAFAFTFTPLGSCPILLPEPFRSILVYLTVLSFTGWVSGAMPVDPTPIAAHLAGTRLGVTIHDGEARVTLLAASLIHLTTPSLS